MPKENKDLSKELVNDLGSIRYEIDNCKRQILTWIHIGQLVKTNTDAKTDNFCGWLQDAFIRLIVIDAYKIYKNSKEYIKTIIQKSAYSAVSDKLLQKSDFHKRLTTLGKIIDPLRNLRNQKFAHIEKYIHEEIMLNLNDLFNALHNLNISVGFIQHYVINSHYVSSLDENENHYFTLSKHEFSLEELEPHIKNDEILKGILKT